MKFKNKNHCNKVLNNILKRKESHNDKRSTVLPFRATYNKHVGLKFQHYVLVIKSLFNIVAYSSCM